MPAQTPLRVAVVRRKDPSAVLFAEAFFHALRIGNKPAIENEGAYREFSFDGVGAQDYATTADQIVAFHPHVVVFSADSELVAAVESKWPTSAKGRPYYVTPNNLGAKVASLIGTNGALRRRILAFTSAATTPPNARFVLHYNETFPDPITRDWAPNSSYDAFYLAAYALYALEPGARPTGPAMAMSVARLLPPGAPVDVGASGILGASSVLRDGENIDLNGATSNLDYDLRTGEPPVDLVVLCVGADPTGRATGAIESGLVYDARAGRLTGEARCP